MKKIGFILMVFVLACMAAACTKTGCKRICECMEMNPDDCVDECMEVAEEEGKDCKKKTRALGKCYNKMDCDPEPCQNEIENWLEACGGYDYYY